MVSIIIPIYNVESYIGDCLNSVCLQKYPEIEVVLVDDCSPDHSMVVAEPFIDRLKKNFTVKVIKHEINRGLSAARNTGVRAAAGKWLYFLDSDDELTSNCIELFVDSINEHGDVDFAIGGIKIVGKNTECRLTTPKYVSGNMLILNEYLHGSWYEMACNKLINRDYFISNNLWFKEGLLHEDQLFSFLLATTATKISTVYQETYIYKIRVMGSITASSGKKNFDSYIYILNYMANSVFQGYSFKTVVLEYALAIRFAYSILLSLYGRNSLTKDDIANYESKVDNICQALNPYKCNLPIILLVKRIIMKLPKIIRKQLLKWHCRRIK